VIQIAQTKTYTNSLPATSEDAYRFPRTLQLQINLTREQLDARIELRTQKMRQLGLEQEVRALWEAGQLGPTAIKAIGYSEFVTYFEGGLNPANGKPMTLDDVYDQICSHTKRLVRRQQSWFKRDDRIKGLAPLAPADLTPVALGPASAGKE
jgi:tRNA dimethylallyltransferase